MLAGTAGNAWGQPATLLKSKEQRVMTGVRFDGNTSTVSMVIKGGPAAKAGIKIGDEILSVDEKYIIQPVDMLDAFANKLPGEVVKLEVRRKNQYIFFDLRLVEVRKGNVEINDDGTVKDLDEPGLMDEPAPELAVNEWSGIPKGLSARLESNRGKV
ncbi:MAG: PDZ domain-containing protein, partial [Pirellulaceae bacterium]|nr:PDZ domain-containing protein [Pirellulaceae bacterium]